MVDPQVTAVLPIASNQGLWETRDPVLPARSNYRTVTATHPF